MHTPTGRGSDRLRGESPLLRRLSVRRTPLGFTVGSHHPGSRSGPVRSQRAGTFGAEARTPEPTWMSYGPGSSCSIVEGPVPCWCGPRHKRDRHSWVAGQTGVSVLDRDPSRHGSPAARIRSETNPRRAAVWKSHVREECPGHRSVGDFWHRGSPSPPRPPRPWVLPK